MQFPSLSLRKPIEAKQREQMVQVQGNQCLNGRCDRNAKVERKTWWHPGCVLGDKTNKRWEHTGSMREGLQTEERVGRPEEEYQGKHR